MMSKRSGVITRRQMMATGVATILGWPRSARAREHEVASAPLPEGDQTLAQDSAVGRLTYPGAAGRPRARVTRYDNDPFVIGIEERLRCTCGCMHSIYICRTTDFTCGYWQDLHAKIVKMTEEKRTAEEIIAAYVSEHGEGYLMAPPTEGFNLAAYFVPGLLITTAGAGLLWYLHRREHVAAIAAAAGPDAGVGPDGLDLSEAEMTRLNAELENLER